MNKRASIVVTILAATSWAFSGCIPGGGSGDGDGNNGAISDAGTDDTSGGDTNTDTSGDMSSMDTGADAIGEDAGGDDAEGSGLQGLQGYCEYYFECGGTYYDDAQDCVDQSVDYWGECRRDELDDFGDCMLGLSCEEWGNPDAYNPSNTDCADEWSAISESPSCE